MIFGETAQVALELIVTRPSFCGAALWVRDRRFGEPELFAPSATLVANMIRFRRLQPQREAPSLFEKEPGYLLGLVEKELFGSQPLRSAAAEAASNRAYSPFLLSPNLCESLDGELIVVFTKGGKQLIAAESYTDGASKSVVVPVDTLEELLSRAEQWLIALGN